MNDTIGALLALTVVAASLAAGLIQDVRRNRSAVPWQPIREPQEPPHVAGDDVTAWRTAGAHRAAAPLPAAPAMPLSPLLHHARQWWRVRQEPLVHVGAVPGWSPADEVGQAGSSPDMLTPAEQIVADHEALAGIGAARDAFSAAMDEALAWFCRDDPALALAVSRHGPSTAADTGLYDLRELEAMLAEVPCG